MSGEFFSHCLRMSGVENNGLQKPMFVVAAASRTPFDIHRHKYILYVDFTYFNRFILNDFH